MEEGDVEVLCCQDRSTTGNELEVTQYEEAASPHVPSFDKQDGYEGYDR